jgi:hypothetical protein
MKKVIECLLTLQILEQESPKRRPEALALREQIPSDMLNRFDKFLGRGKKAVALVQNGICRGCQIQIPIGLVNALILGASAFTCGNCGRYLCLLPEDAISFQGRNKPEAPRVRKVVVPTLRQKSARPRRKSPDRLSNAVVPTST